jgi:flagellar biosynthesis GTPase FlhF
MVELAAQSNLPLIYMCMGQRVPEDLQEATPQNFIAHIFREKMTPMFF